jgi:tetratricopeptide (TPR) repeat protein
LEVAGERRHTMSIETRTIAVALAALLLAAGPGPSARAQGALVDAHAEVVAALYAASATVAAVQKEADSKVRADQARIAALAAQVKAGDRRRRAELAAAEGAFVTQLAEKDRAYAQAIAGYRAGVTDIASTPQGAAALARFNAGEEAGALAALDALQGASEAASPNLTGIQKAVGERHIAALALEARARGKVTTASAIARFEGVTRLDPGVASDWIDLAGLYADVGRLGDADRAAGAALAAATSEGERAVALRLQSALRGRQGDFAGAWTAFSRSFAIERTLALANPGDVGAQADLAEALAASVGYLEEAGDFPGARRAAGQSLDFARSLAAANPTNDYIRGFLSSDLRVLAWAAVDEGDLTAARASMDESVAIARSRAAASRGDEAWLAEVLNDLANLKQAQGDIAGAQATFEESLAIWRKVSLSDPAAQPPREGAAVALWYDGILLQATGDLAGAQRALMASHQVFVQFLATDQSDFSAQENDAFVRFHLAMIPASGVHFADLTPFYDQADRLGRLGPTDELLAAEVRRLVASGAGPEQGERASAALELSIADAEFAGGERAFALMSYQAALVLARRLAAGDAHPADLQRVVGQCLSHLAPVRGSGVSWPQAASQWEAMEKAGTLATADKPLLQEAARHAMGKPAAMAETFEGQDVDAVRSMAAADPSNVDLEEDLWFGLDETGDTLAAAGDVAGARGDFEEGLAIARRLAAADPGAAELQRDVAVSLAKLAHLPASSDAK